MTGLELKNLSEREGVTGALKRLDADVQIEMPLEQTFLDLPLTELNLGVRAYNGLMRARVETVGKLVEAIMSECGIEHIRNVGKTSVYEIKTVLLEEGYARLNDSMKLDFWNKIVEVNRI